MNGDGLRIVVRVTPVHDCRNPVSLDPVRKRVDPSSWHWILNPPDTIALEQALRIRDRFPACRIRVVSVSPPDTDGVLRECLAAGANEVARLWDDGLEDADPHAIAVLLAALILMKPFDLVLAGWRRADLEQGQTGPMLAEVLGLPQITCARGVDPDRDLNRIRVEKRVPGSLLTLSCGVPALVTFDKGPPLRYPRHPDRRKAGKAAIRAYDLAAVGLKEPPANLVRLERLTSPKPTRRSTLGASAAMPVAARLQRIMAGGGSAKKESNIRRCPDRASTVKAVEDLLREKLVVLP